MKRLAILISLVALIGLTLASPVLAAAPSNDDIGSPTIIGAVPFNDSVDTTEATPEATDPDFCFGPGGSTVWYSFTPTEDGWHQADTFGSDYDTTLYVGTPDGSGGINVLDCNDDFGSLQSRVLWEADAGIEYFLMVGTFGGDSGGTLVFNLDVSDPPPPPPTIDLTVDGTGSFTKSGVATIRGTIACTGDVQFVDLFMDVSQRVGRYTIRGFGGTFFEGCSESPTPWSVEVFGDNGTFAGGAAVVNAFAFGCNTFECAEDSVSQTTRLRR